MTAPQSALDSEEESQRDREKRDGRKEESSKHSIFSLWARRVRGAVGRWWRAGCRGRHGSGVARQSQQHGVVPATQSFVNRQIAMEDVRSVDVQLLLAA